MYAAKEAGRGRYEVFRHEMARELGELLGLEHELRLGLERGEFELHYQPLIDLDTHGDRRRGGARCAGARRPAGLVAAERFIPVAESTGLIMQLGEFVLREACRQTAAWDAAGVLPDGFVTWVNVSGKQISAGGLERAGAADPRRAGPRAEPARAGGDRDRRRPRGPRGRAGAEPS